MSIPTDALAEWNKTWDASTGLWWQDSPGHTAEVAQLPRVRPIPSAASRLVLAGEAGWLGKIDAHAVLKAIAAAQVVDDNSFRGCFRWYQEETKPNDTNAAFFTGLGLISLRLAHFESLKANSQTLLSNILINLQHWFDRAAEHRAMNYPNKFLGDLVCAWLLHEINGTDDDDQQLQKTMIDAAHYWDHHHWGWGEHMSDIYAAVCLDELSALLLLSKHLPHPVRVAYQKLFDKLIALEDEFDDGPRVPAIRSYAFTTSPAHRSYREGILPLDAPSLEELHRQPSMPRNSDLNRFTNRPPLGSLLYRKKWHEIALARHPRGHDVRIACFGGMTAVARIEKDARLGTMSRFPIMRGADHHNWGLSWQSFPVCLWKPSGDWGFLQWETRAGQRVRAHPAEEKQLAYLGNALAESVNPPIVGRTFSLQQGGDALVLRLMPMTLTEWDSLHDRFRLVGQSGEILDTPKQSVMSTLHWHQRQFVYAGRTISVQCIPLFSGAAIESFKRQTFDGHPANDLDVTVDRNRLATLRCVPILWGISLNGEIKEPPDIHPIHDDTATPRSAEESILRLHWEWGTTRWDAIIDPLAAEPLVEL